MIKEITASGKDVSEAKENARLALGADELADVSYEILDAGSRGIFGLIGVKPALVKASIELPDAPPRVRQERRPQAAAEPRQRTNDQLRQNNNSNHNNRRPKPDRPVRQDRQPDNRPSKPRSEVIPESALSLVPVEVQPGEDRALDFVKTLISDIGLDAEAKLYAAGDGSRRIVVSGEGASALIGHHGDTLDSLQYLANLACAQNNTKGEHDKSRVTIDIEGYRAKREDALRALARRMAEKALRNKRNVMLEPMNPYERRIIHDEVSNIDDVTTSSIGSDTSRRVVIYFEKNPSAKETAPAESVAETAAPAEPDMEVTAENTAESVAPVEAVPEKAEVTVSDDAAGVPESDSEADADTDEKNDSAL